MYASNQYGWYSYKEGWFVNNSRYGDWHIAQCAVNLAHLAGEVDGAGFDEDGDCVVSVADPSKRIVPDPVTSAQFDKMIETALDTWVFSPEADDIYLHLDKPLLAMVGGMIDPIEINQHIVATNDWDGLMHWMASLVTRYEPDFVFTLYV